MDLILQNKKQTIKKVDKFGVAKFMLHCCQTETTFSDLIAIHTAGCFILLIHFKLGQLACTSALLERLFYDWY